jgi:cytochrome c553
MRKRRLICWFALALTEIAVGPLFAATPMEIAKTEYEEVTALEPDMESGREAYLTCTVCHGPEGWGTVDGKYPQIAGQLRSVVIKQLADIRAHNRDNPVMYPFSLPKTLGGPQKVADVAAYVAALPMTSHNGVGPGNDLALGKQLYDDNCANCHGESGEGKPGEQVPAIAGQHFNYLVRQFDLIRTNRRRNADPKMAEQISSFSPREETAVLDYTSRLRPPGDKLAAEGWTNPDFPGFVRRPFVEGPPLPEIAPMPEPPAVPAIRKRRGIPEPASMSGMPGAAAMPEPPPMPPFPESPQVPETPAAPPIPSSMQ